jgi:hypothetical protein
MSVLDEVLERARLQNAVVAFDLDSTLLDNRPRSARIFREFGEHADIAELRSADPVIFHTWNLEEALVNAGILPERAKEIYPTLRQFWWERFFTSDYCTEDLPIKGAPEFAQAVAAGGARIAYVTGRHEAMRAGTMLSLERYRFPLPALRVHLLMKPTFDMLDDAWKIEAYEQLRVMGAVVAAFDNEPTHLNGYGMAFPEAMLVHLATDHSGRPVVLLPHVRPIRDFGDALNRKSA